MDDTDTLTDAIVTPPDDVLAPSPLRPIPEDTQYAIFERLRMLREQKLRIEQEIRILAGDDALWERVPAHCKRCGWDWTPFNPFMPPLTCPRCGSTSWNRKPTQFSRKPSDPPAASWRQRKGGPQKHGDSVIRYRARDLRRSKKIPPIPQTPTTPPAPWEIAPLESPVSPWAKSIAIPPPPAPSPPPTPRTPLSQQLLQLRDDAYEPQPERQASRLAPPPAPSPILTEDESLKKTVENINAVEVETEVMPSDLRTRNAPRGLLSMQESAPAGDHTEPASVTSVEPPAPMLELMNELEEQEAREEASQDEIEQPQPEPPLQRLGEITPPAGDDAPPPPPADIPPEQVGIPRTDAEREELQRAKEDVWPTTRPDD